MANALVEFLGGLASAIREVTDIPPEVKMKPVKFADKIRNIKKGVDVSGVTATAADVLAGKSFVDAGGNSVDGTMPNNGNYSANATGLTTTGGTRYIFGMIPEGYHNGEGMIGVRLYKKEATPSKETQTIDANMFQFVVNPIPDEYQDVTNVTATADDVRSGKIFVDAEGNEVEGTLIVKETVENVIWVGTSSGVSNSLAGNGIVRYVTFMNHDGSVEYGKKSVIVGEDCVDPVAAGHMDTPTRESTAQYNYTFSGGWATVPNGGKDANALKAVNEDRTVYANFVSAVRYYTITFYDSDGTTVLTTKSVAYGSVPSYTPTKEGYNHGGWNPTPVAVTGEASYIAVWVEKPAFATATWAKIAEICTAGNQSTYFAIGDTRDEVITYEDGTTETVTFEIVDLNPSGIISGSKMAVMASHVLATPKRYHSTANGTSLYYMTSEMLTYLSKTLVKLFPEDMQAVMKSVSMPYANGSSKLHIPTAYMVIGYNKVYGSPSVEKNKMLAAFKNGKSRVCKTVGGIAVEWWAADTVATSSSSSIYYSSYFDTSGAFKYQGDATKEKYIRPMFFI